MFTAQPRLVWLLIFTAGSSTNNQKLVCSMPSPLLCGLKLGTGYLWASDYSHEPGGRSRSSGGSYILPHLPPSEDEESCMSPGEAKEKDA